jgi:protease I
MSDLRGKRVAIIVTDGFEQIEMTSPREALEREGAKCTLIAPKEGEVQGLKHHDKADKFKADMTLASANAKDFDALMLPGGVINADAIRIDKKAQQFAQEIDRAGKPIAVICHGPWLLVSAGLMNGRHVTSWPTLKDDLECAGARWEDKEYIRDRNWVSSRKPDDLPVFNREMVNCFAEGKGTTPEKNDSREIRA